MFMFKKAFKIGLLCPIVYCSEGVEMREYEDNHIIPRRGNPIRNTTYTRNDLMKFPFFEKNDEEEAEFIKNFNENYNVKGIDRNIFEETTERTTTTKIEEIPEQSEEETDPRVYNKPRGSVTKIWGDAECITARCRWAVFGYLNATNDTSTNQTGNGDLDTFNGIYNQVSNLSGLNLAGFLSLLTLVFGVIGFIIKMCWKFRKPIKRFYDIVTFKSWRAPNELNSPQPATNPNAYMNPAFMSELSAMPGPTAPPTNSAPFGSGISNFPSTSGISNCPSTSCMKSYPSTCELATIALPQYANIPCIPKSALAYTTVAICPDNVVSQVTYSNLMHPPIPGSEHQDMNGKRVVQGSNNNSNDTTKK